MNGSFRLKKAVDIFRIFLTCRIFCHFACAIQRQIVAELLSLRDVNHCPIIALRLSENTRQVIPNLPKPSVKTIVNQKRIIFFKKNLINYDL